MTHTRRTALAGLAIGLALTASACGGGSAVSNSAAPSGAVSSASARTTGDAFAPGSAVDAASVKQMFSAAMSSATTVHVEMRMTGQVAMSGSGDMDMAAKPLKAALHLASSSLGGDITMLMVDNHMYLKSKTFGDKYVGVAIDDKNSPLARMGLDSLDPTAMFDRFGDAVTGGTYVGKETIDGTETDHYRMTVDTEALASAMPSAAAGATGSMPTSETIDVWFDQDGRYKQMSTAVGGEKVTESFSEWGEPVTVTAPPAGQVKDMTSLMNGATGKSAQ